MLEDNRDNRDELFQLLKELSKASVKFVVCGGVAGVLHGVERATYDLDISVSLDTENLKKIIKVADKFKLKPRIPEPVENLLSESKRNEWVEKKGALVYTFSSLKGPLQLDIFLSYPKSYEMLCKSAKQLKIDDLKILVSSIDDLLLAKQKVVPLRDKDKIDIKELENLRKKNNAKKKEED